MGLFKKLIRALKKRIWPTYYVVYPNKKWMFCPKFPDEYVYCVALFEFAEWLQPYEGEYELFFDKDANKRAIRFRDKELAVLCRLLWG